MYIIPQNTFMCIFIFKRTYFYLSVHILPLCHLILWNDLKFLNVKEEYHPKLVGFVLPKKDPFFSLSRFFSRAHIYFLYHFSTTGILELPFPFCPAESIFGTSRKKISISKIIKSNYQYMMNRTQHISKGHNQ